MLWREKLVESHAFMKKIYLSPIPPAFLELLSASFFSPKNKYHEKILSSCFCPFVGGM